MNKDTKKSLLYPAIHKYYSALKSLEQFDKGNDLFENISHLDKFFSEYRNITFVLQKSLAHSELKGIYEKNRDKYLKNDVSKWLLETRNTVLKEHPFELEKKITITTYSPIYSSVEIEQAFTIENDVEYSSLFESLKLFINKDKAVEVYFSVKFSFYEKGKDKELFEDFIAGIKNMSIFLNAMKNAINEECELCNQLQGKIDKMTFYKIPGNMLFIEDYIYYVKNNEFEKAERTETLMNFSGGDISGKSVLSNECMRFPLTSFINNHQNIGIRGKNAFDIFIYSHIMIFTIQKKLMPTFMIIYEDETYELKPFTTTVKTTTYRKINEIAKSIEQENIKSVFFVNEMIHYSTEGNNYQDIMESNSHERIKYKTSESLGFFMVDENLQSPSFFFNIDRINDLGYINSILSIPDKSSSVSSFFHPIINEFKRLKNNK